MLYAVAPAGRAARMAAAPSNVNRSLPGLGGGRARGAREEQGAGGDVDEVVPAVDVEAEEAAAMLGAAEAGVADEAERASGDQDDADQTAERLRRGGPSPRRRACRHRSFAPPGRRLRAERYCATPVEPSDDEDRPEG